MADPVERQVLEGLRARRAEAGELLIRLHYRSVHRFLAMLTCDVHRAEDLTQETFAAAWANLSALTGESSLGGWLRKIAYGKFVDDYRRRRRQASLIEAASRRAPANPQAGPLADLLAGERVAGLAEAMGRLEASDRVALVARYIEEMDSEQIGRLLGKSPQAARARVSRAGRRLRALLNGKMTP